MTRRTQGFFQSEVDQFVQVINTAQNVDFAEVQDIVGGLAVVSNDQIEFNEIGKFLVWGQAHVGRVSPTGFEQLHLWWEHNNGGGYAAIVSGIVKETIDTTDEDEIHSWGLAPFVVSINQVTERVRLRMQADLLVLSGVFDINSSEVPTIPTRAPAITLNVLKISDTP